MNEVIHAIGPWFGVLLVIGIPVALAWWLSDGFRGVLSWPGGGRQELRLVYNPVEQRYTTAIVESDSGHVVGYGK